ncbi:hypothetical protein DFH94DRAFT_725322 [Russula ochroleuca]|jgi:hypothetical protein|uniref:Uncharacterized protein n=1 Tax=Russula ochroleuca TaxID=152965 RepID=A0A9P5TBR9_9AGAM|nr:hypothetical protein DFH94DRAFT_725322 [Russula ochroleuca]
MQQGKTSEGLSKVYFLQQRRMPTYRKVPSLVLPRANSETQAGNVMESPNNGAKCTASRRTGPAMFCEGEAYHGPVFVSLYGPLILVHVTRHRQARANVPVHGVQHEHEERLTRATCLPFDAIPEVHARFQNHAQCEARTWHSTRSRTRRAALSGARSRARLTLQLETVSAAHDSGVFIYIVVHLRRDPWQGHLHADSASRPLCF